MIAARTLQAFLNTAGGYNLAVDGQFGPRSYAAARDYLADRRYPATWSDARTYVALEQLFLNAAINALLLVDGVDGPKTAAARARYDAMAVKPQPTITPPPAPPTPRTQWPRQSEVPAFFGQDPHSISYGYVTPPYQMFADYRRWSEHRVSRFMCHALVKAPLQRILLGALDHYGAAELRRLNLDMFSGCRVVRIITGGVGYSMHSWGIAVDIDAANNEFRDTWESGKMDGAEYRAFVDLWYAEGAINLGRERNYDPMHFQFARL